MHGFLGIEGQREQVVHAGSFQAHPSYPPARLPPRNEPLVLKILIKGHRWLISLERCLIYRRGRSGVVGGPAMNFDF